MTHARLEAHHFFSEVQIWELLGALSRPRAKPVFGEKNRTATQLDEKSHGLYKYIMRIVQKPSGLYFRRIWVKEPRHSQT